MRIPDESNAVSEVKHRHGNSVASLNCAPINKSIIYIMARKEKAPIYKLFRSKAPKTQQICHYRHAKNLLLETLDPMSKVRLLT